jgi:hypothetical protein
VKSDGSIWFTDPPFGIYSFYEGERITPELPHTNVYRIDGTTGAISLVADDVDHPNGLAFSPDESCSTCGEPERAAQHPRLRRGRREAPQPPRLHPLRAARRRTASAWMSRATSGAAGAWGRRGSTA